MVCRGRAICGYRTPGVLVECWNTLWTDFSGCPKDHGRCPEMQRCNRNCGAKVAFSWKDEVSFMA